ncbi:MAG: amino acid ABC transporter substrate-binding protein [Pseudomonadota bacterium]
MAKLRALLRAAFAVLLASTTPLALAEATTQAQPIRIGASVSRTGELAQFGVQVERGLRMWQRDLSDRGSLLGRPVNLELYDDGSDPTRAIEQYLEMRAAGIDLFVSPYSSPLTLAVRDALGDADYAMLSIATAPTIWTDAQSDGEVQTTRIFGLYTPAQQNMLPFLQLAAERGLTSLALVHQDSAFPNAVAAGVRERAGQHGLTLVLDASYPQAAPDFDALARRLRRTNAQAIVVGSYLDDGRALARAAHAAGVRAELIAFSGGPALREFASGLDAAAVNGVISSVQWMRSARLPGSFDFGFRYRERFEVYPSYDAAGGYAAGQVFEAAIRLAGSDGVRAVREQLGSLKFRSLLGHYRVDAAGRQIAKRTYLVQWQDQHISLIFPSYLARWDVLYPLPWNR